MGFFGVFIIITKGTFLLEPGDATGNILAVVSSFLWALYTILSKPLLDRHSPLKVTTYSMITGSVLLIPFVPFYLDFHELMRLSFSGWAILSFTVVFSIVIAFFSGTGGKKDWPFTNHYLSILNTCFCCIFCLSSHPRTALFSQLVGAAIVFSASGWREGTDQITRDDRPT